LALFGLIVRFLILPNQYTNRIIGYSMIYLAVFQCCTDQQMAASPPSKIYAFPEAVASLLKSNAGAEGGLDGSSGLAWAFSRKELLIWMYDEAEAASMHTRSLPYTSDKKHFVSIALHKVKR
jgi:hypothetical protein